MKQVNEFLDLKIILALKVMVNHSTNRRSLNEAVLYLWFSFGDPT